MTARKEESGWPAGPWVEVRGHPGEPTRLLLCAFQSAPARCRGKRWREGHRLDGHRPGTVQWLEARGILVVREFQSAAGAMPAEGDGVRGAR